MLSALMSTFTPRTAPGTTDRSAPSQSTQRYSTAVSIAAEGAAPGSQAQPAPQSAPSQAVSIGAFVPPLARGDAPGGVESGRSATAAYEESGAQGAGGRAGSGEWMSAAVTQPDAPSFAESTREIQRADDAQKAAVMAEQRRASLDYLVSSMKQAARAVGAEGSDAMRQAISAYAEF